MKKFMVCLMVVALFAGQAFAATFQEKMDEARLLVKDGKLSEARTCYKEAEALTDDPLQKGEAVFPAAYYGLFSLGKFAEAIPEFSSILELEGIGGYREVETHRLIAHCLKHLGRYAEAIFEYEKNLSIEGDESWLGHLHGEASYCIALCNQALGDKQKALQGFVNTLLNYGRVGLGDNLEKAYMSIDHNLLCEIYELDTNAKYNAFLRKLWLALKPITADKAVVAERIKTDMISEN